MIKKVVKRNGELGLEFTDAELEELGLKKGDQIEWFIEGTKFGFKKAKKK